MVVMNFASSAPINKWSSDRQACEGNDGVSATNKSNNGMDFMSVLSQSDGS